MHGFWPGLHFWKPKPSYQSCSFQGYNSQLRPDCHVGGHMFLLVGEIFIWLGIGNWKFHFLLPAMKCMQHVADRWPELPDVGLPDVRVLELGNWDHGRCTLLWLPPSSHSEEKCVYILGWQLDDLSSTAIYACRNLIMPFTWQSGVLLIGLSQLLRPQQA